MVIDTADRGRQPAGAATQLQIAPGNYATLRAPVEATAVRAAQWQRYLLRGNTPFCMQPSPLIGVGSSLPVTSPEVLTRKMTASGVASRSLAGSGAPERQYAIA